MSPPQASASEVSSRFPRVSGDEPRPPVNIGMGQVFSPRERG